MSCRSWTSTGAWRPIPGSTRRSITFVTAPGRRRLWRRTRRHDARGRVRGERARLGLSRRARCRSTTAPIRCCCRASAIACRLRSTPSRRPGGPVRARLVDVGAGAAEADYAGKEIRGAVVLGDAGIGRLWQEAVKKRGAIGVVSTEIAPYIRPSDPAAMSEAQKDVLQWGGIPYDATVKGFGFKASWRAASRMRERLRSAVPSPCASRSIRRFYEGPTRTLVAELPGRTLPAERIVLVAHVQEPGANDDASGCATLYGLARALNEAIASGALPRPGSHAHVHVGGRGARQPPVDHVAARRGARRPVHDGDGHDRRGHVEDRRHVS